jgi:hypothetical protein
MTWLAENALAIWMGGAVALTMACIVYSQTRTNAALCGVLGVIAVVAALLFYNWMVETPREAVARSLYGLAAAVEANDVQGTLRFISPTGPPAIKQLRSDVESLMPQVRIERARVMGAPDIEMAADGKRAVVKCQGIVVAVNKRDGMKGGGEDDFTLEWKRDGDRWLLSDFASKRDWNGAVRRPGK